MVDKSVLTAQTSVEFTPADGGGSGYSPIKLVIEMDDRKHPDQTMHGTMRIRLYPAAPYKDPYNFIEYLSDGTTVIHQASGMGLPQVGIVETVFVHPFEHCGYSFRVTQGTLTKTTEIRYRYVEGTLVFTGGREFDLPYPVVAGPAPTLGYAPSIADSIELIRVGQYFNGNGDDITASLVLQFDADKQKLLASDHVYGEVHYRFRTEYVIADYVPYQYSDMLAYYIPNDSDYGSLIGYPPTTTVDGMKNGTVVFQVQMPPAIGADFELYRVESVAIVNEKGVWEKPKAWPNDGVYGDIPDKILDTASSYLETSRVHEIATVSMVNRQRSNESTASVKLEALPTNFSYEEKKSNNAKVADSYLRNVKNFPLTTMRTVRYIVPVAMPYDGYPPKQYEEKAWIKALVTLPNGDVTKQALSHTVWTKYKIKLVVKAGSMPTPAQSTLERNAKIDPVTGMPDTTYDFQAAYINAVFRRMWDAIDWDTIKKQIVSRYDPDVYEVTFDTSMPTSNAPTS